MDKQEFLSKLRIALNGKVDPHVVTENINYYEDYINVEVRKGRSEEEVLQMLGDPRLIARTIAETSPAGGGSEYYQNGNPQQTPYESGSYQEEEQASGYRAVYQQEEYRGGKVKVFHIPGWVWTIVTILVVVLIFSVVLSVLSFLAPVIITALVVIFFVKLFGEWLN